MITKGTGGIGNWRTGGDHPIYDITENGQNIEKSSRDLRTFVVTQNPKKGHQLTLMWIVLVIGGRWPYSWCLVGCCCQDRINKKEFLAFILVLYRPLTHLFILSTALSHTHTHTLDWRLSQPGFDPRFGNLALLATLMSSGRTKQICLWMTIYIYIYIYIYINSLMKYCLTLV